ncbi:hypothetical protein FB451DRAFT_1407677 [Mycena latifolia]|nr:hypothetical protein FB451DRAFT_1407677 [Mycena latifolia]
MSDLPVGSSLASDLHVGLHGKPKLVASPAASDWLIDMIFSAKTAAAAEFIPAPYIRAALTTVVNFLETVDKINRNREDLKDLCTNILEIVAILREEFSIHGNTGTPRFMGLCDDFIGLLNGLHGDLEKLDTNRQSIRGWFKEMIRATSAADQIERCKGRLIDLRLNFMLVATINTTLNVAQIHKNVTANESAYYSHGQRTQEGNTMSTALKSTCHYKHRQAPVDTIHISTIVQSIPYTTLPGALAQHLDWPEFYAALTPSWHRSSEWTLGVVADPSRTALYKRGTKASWKRSTFPSGSFKAAEPTETLEAKILLLSFIKFDDMHMNMLTMSWLSQAHASFGRGIFEGDCRYGES